MTDIQILHNAIMLFDRIEHNQKNDYDYKMLAHQMGADLRRFILKALKKRERKVEAIHKVEITKNHIDLYA